MDIVVRQEKATDFTEVYEVNKLAFGQENESKLVELLRKNKDVFVPELSIVAIANHKVVGHILFSKVKIKDKNNHQHKSLALAPMAVIPEFQKMGIGRQLINKGLTTAKSLGFKSVIVLGHEHYYPKFGFEPAFKWHINPPFDVPPEAFMAIALESNGLSNVSGTVIYPTEFEAV